MKKRDRNPDNLPPFKKGLRFGDVRDAKALAKKRGVVWVVENRPGLFEQDHQDVDDGPQHADDELIGIGEVARRTGMHRSTLAIWIAAGTHEVPEPDIAGDRRYWRWGTIRKWQTRRTKGLR
ncbi:MAG: hypothetical protein ABIP48_09145 [Planctomycetota bacterium]